MINFKDETSVKGLVLADFFATWCGPCKMLGPVLEEIKKEYEGKVKVIKVDIDQNEELTNSFGVQSVPTLLLVKDGSVIDHKIGYQPKQVLVDWLNKYL